MKTKQAAKGMSMLDLAGLQPNFQRTCRVPEGKDNSLPAGLGPFPIYRASDFRSGTPKKWKPSDFFTPMYRQEAMWINFPQRNQKNPYALVVAAGSINAVTGEQIKVVNGDLEARLEKDQNYLVVPPQPRIDGWKDGENGRVYQFVAAQMGSGQTIEGQITGKEKIGGIQLIAYAPRKGINLKIQNTPHDHALGVASLGMDDPVEDIVAGGMGIDDNDDMIYGSEELCLMSFQEHIPVSHALKSFAPPSAHRLVGARSGTRGIVSMGLGRGGEITQKIYPDGYGYSVWHKNPIARAMVNLISPEDFRQITGTNPPETPVTFERYQQLGIPWFELGDKKYKDTTGSDIFGKLKSLHD